MNINTFYVDESGSMTKKGLNCKSNHYFIICLIKTSNSDRLKKILKKFISSNLNTLKNMDKQNKMFYKDGRFKELKGCALNKKMKLQFVKYICQNHLFDIFYICVNNQTVDNILYSNTARAFNYLLRLSLEYNTKNKCINNSSNYFYIDERNIKTNSKSTLCDYLNIELVLANHLQKSFAVKYCKSEDSVLIQLADFFSNLYYSYIISKGVYDNVIESLRKKGYIKNEFIFPICY